MFRGLTFGVQGRGFRQHPLNINFCESREGKESSSEGYVAPALPRNSSPATPNAPEPSNHSSAKAAGAAPC